MSQQKQKGPLGPAEGPDSTGGAVGLKRTAPASDTLLRELEGAVKEERKQESFEKRKRRILERCGCL